MPLDRGTLARIDGRVFVELDHTNGVQVVKVPVSDAVWSIWLRYCDALGLTMGQAVAALISHELGTVVGGASEGRCSIVSAHTENGKNRWIVESEI